MDGRVAVYDSFDGLPPSCQSLFQASAKENGVFFSLPWFDNLRRTALADHGVRLYAVESLAAGVAPGQVRLILPLIFRLERGGAAARELAACANYYSSLFGPLVAPGLDEAALQRDLALLAQSIAQDASGWHTVRLHPMSSEARSVALCASAFRRAGMAVQSYFCFGNWYLSVNGRSYQQYLQSLPSRLRNTLARKSRQLAASHDARIVIIKDEADVDEGIAAFERVYRSSWKPAEAHPEFITGLIRTCAQHGWLRLGVAYVDNAPAAAQLWIVCHGVASIYKLAYDERFAALSIGSILTARMMEHVIDVDKVGEVDYLTGDDDYKRDWMSHRRERWGLVAFNLRTVRGILGAIRHIGGRWLKAWWLRARTA